MLTKILADQRLLSLDLLSVHLIRNVKGSTIISFHPNLKMSTTTAPYLHTRIRFAGTVFLTKNKFHRQAFLIFTFRPKCILAEHVPKIARPYIRSVDLHLACDVRMG